MNKTITILFIAIAATVIVFYTIQYNNGYTISITTPEDSYMVKSYYEQDGCVIFTDMSGYERKLCGQYAICNHIRK